ncbi:MAG: NAD(P)/FAD-dependent oxidoreductase [Candidatus Aminicenantia bacterium]
MRVLIVGAGPAGLFSAYALRGKAEITIFDRGPSLEERLKDIENVVFGVGGAGLFSDGKLNFSPEIGNNLENIISSSELSSLLNEVEEIFRNFGIKVQESNHEKIKNLETKAAQLGMKFIPIRQAHVGSDNLPQFIRSFAEELEKNKVKFLCKKEVKDVYEDRIITSDGEEIFFDRMILAPGRSGARWLEEVVKKLGISFIYNPIDIGVRVEVPSIIMEEICNINWDPKIHIRTPSYDDFVRTFCVSPYGYVVKESHNEFCLVNGHSLRGRRSENTNFAFLVKVSLTEPLENTNLYGESIALQATTIGGGKPILHRLGDLLDGRRSTWSRIERSNVTPTLMDVTPGDISMALPYRFVKDIIEGLEILDRLIPGVADNSTLLYATEIKFHGLKVLTDKFMKTSIPSIYAAGDGAGLSRGIVGASVSGLLAGKGILNEI